MEQNRECRNKPTPLDQLICDGEGKHIECDSLFNNWCLENCAYMCRNETRPPSYTTHKINSKRIKDVSVRVETMEILEENIGSKILDISCSNVFF